MHITAWTTPRIDPAEQRRHLLVRASRGDTVEMHDHPSPDDEVHGKQEPPECPNVRPVQLDGTDVLTGCWTTR